MAKAALSLLGFMAEPPAMDYLMNVCTVATQAEALQAWNDAKDLLQRTPAPAGAPGHPDIQDIPQQYWPYLQQVEHFPGFLAMVGGQQGAFKLVEIDPILCYQFHVIEGVGEARAQGYQATGLLEDAIKACLPAQREPSHHVIIPDPQGFALTSHNLNFSLLGPVDGPAFHLDAPFIGFAFGLKFPHVAVVRYNGQCFLSNGYHRTVALRKLGVTHVPCVFLDATDYSQTGGLQPGFFPPNQMLGTNPPTVGHLAGAAAYPVLLREYKKVIRITATESLIPMDF